MYDPIPLTMNIAELKITIRCRKKNLKNEIEILSSPLHKMFT